MRLLLGLLIILFVFPSFAKKQRKGHATKKYNLSDPMSDNSSINIGKSVSDMDSIIYLRKDFNDYHKIDRKKRPSFLPKSKKL